MSVEVCARVCTRERANACGLIVNDSSAKRMRAQQPGKNTSCASAGRNSESDQTVGFFSPLTLSFSVFILQRRDVNAVAHAFIADAVDGFRRGK